MRRRPILLMLGFVFLSFLTCSTIFGQTLEAKGDGTQSGERPSFRVLNHPTEHRLQRGTSFDGDVRKLRQIPPQKFELPEREEPEPNPTFLPGTTAPLSAPKPSSPVPPTLSGPAPPTSNSFEGLDFSNWGAGHPPDTNGDVGPAVYVQTINTSVGIYRKSDGVRLAAFTFNTLMNGHFGNLCDTNNFGDPVVLYDTFEDRWVITDFAFQVDGSGNIVNPPGAFQCFAVSKTGDPVSGGWNFYSVHVTGGLADYPKLAIWPDGIYMSANVFGYPAGASFQNPRVWAFNKAQMYAGAPSVQVVSFDAPPNDFTVIPSNARLQAGTPPVGTPNYFVSTWLFTNALTVYKFHVDWNRTSLSTFSGPDTPLAATSWPNASVPNAPSQGGNNLDVLQIRAMVQNQYSNFGGTESLWLAHTVRRANTTGFAAPRYYQVNVTGGTVAASLPQAATWDPDGANVMYRFMPSVAVDRAGDMAMGYSTSSSTTFPAIQYAGRLAGDPVNTLTQTEQLLVQGTGTQTGNCGSSACIRWGDYSAMTLDPDGCTFWYTNLYYQTSGLAFNTKIGAFSFPSCTPVGSGGTLSGTVTALGSGTPISGAAVALGSRTTTTAADGTYSFTSLPAGTYPSITVVSSGFNSSAANNIAINDGATTTQNFSLTPAASSGCLVDTTQADFQTGTATNCDLTSSPGDVILSNAPTVDQQNTTLGTSGVGITTTTFGGQTFTPSVTGQMTRVDINLFCSGCTGTTPNLTLSLRATSSGLPTGADLASTTIAGFSNGGVASFFTATFSSPPTLTAGTQYALVIRPTVNPSPGTYALTRSGTATAGADVYPGGTRVAGATSGTVWSIPLTGGVSTDAGFKVFMQTGFASPGTFTSSVKDANPAAGTVAHWNTLSWTATTPTNTNIQFQAAASNSPSGPFNFVGPDGTAGTFFTNGGSLAQFNGNRYLQYQASLTTTDSTVGPTLSDVTVCFHDLTTTTTTLTSSANPSVFGQPVTFTATVTPVPPDGEMVTFNDGTTSLGTGALSGGVATLTTSLLTDGSHSMNAVYGGDSTFLASTGILDTNPQVVAGTDISTTQTYKPSPANAGGKLTFTAVVTNNGPATANVSFSEAFAGDSYLLVSANSTLGSCTGTGPVNCNLGSMANGASATVTVVVTPLRLARTLTATATATPDIPDTNSANNSASNTVKVRPKPFHF